MKRLGRYLIIAYSVLLVLMLTAWLVRYSMQGGRRINPKIEKAIVRFAKFPDEVDSLFTPGALADKRYIFDTSTKTGFTYYADTSALPAGRLLVSTFDKNKALVIELLDIRKNKAVRIWHISPDTVIHYTPGTGLTAANIRLMHPLLLKDSSIIFNTQSSLIKINKESRVVWANRKIFHHSIEYADDTSIWACLRIVSKKPVYIVSYTDTLVNDGIALVNSVDGKIIFQKSIFDILNQNGYKYLLAIGRFEPDAFHLNEVNPALADGKYWKKGDLLISIRHRNTVFLYRPSTNKVLWVKTGVWANQHSCTFVDDHRIMVLGNDVIRTDTYMKLLKTSNSIYVYDFENDKIDTPYTQILGRLKMSTFDEGRCNILPNGDVFFDESNNGKVYIFDPDKLKLTYCERIDSKHIKMMNLVRYVPR